MTTTSNRIYLFDRFIISYCLLMVLLILVLGRPLSEYSGELLFYGAVAVLAVLLVRYLKEEANRVARFFRLLYPVLLFSFFYRTTGGTMFLVFDQFYDWQLVEFEKAVLGVHPTLFIDKHLLNPWLTDIIMFCYFSYYFMIPVFFLAACRNRDNDVIVNAMSAVTLTFFVSYLLFFLYPVEGPRWHFAEVYTNEVDGILFKPLVDLVMQNAAVRGGCMPSSHFAVALVLTMFCYRHYRRWFWRMAVLTTGMAVGTFWGRFHYVSDVVVGGGIGLAATLLIWKLSGNSRAKRGRESSQPALGVRHAS